jgi:hypothetical protein
MVSHGCCFGLSIVHGRVQQIEMASKILDDCVFINSILDDCVFINKNAGAYFNHKDQTKYLKAHMNYLRQ